MELFFVGLIGMAVLMVLSALVRRLAGRVPVFASVAPGVIPAQVAGHPTRMVAANKVQPNPPAPRFNPPERILPWMVGDLFPRGIGGRDVGALLMDLSVHGYLRIDSRTRSTGRRAQPDDWVLVRTDKDASRLTGGPRELLAMVFPQGRPGDWTQIDDVRGRVRSGLGRIVRDVMVNDAARTIGSTTRTKDPVRTALNAQVAQFHQYLRTAEVGSIRVDEAAGIFSRYLPWAIALGEAQHWANVFKDVAATVDLSGADAYLATAWASDLAWFTAMDFGAIDFGSMDGFTDGFTSFSDGIGTLGTSMDGFVSDFGGHTTCGGSTCASSSCSGSSCAGSNGCGSSCGGSSGCGSGCSS